MGGSGGREDAAVGTRPWPLIGALALLVAANLLNNVAAPGLYLLWACLAIVGLALLARADGLHPRDWGVGPVGRTAARAAVALACVVAVGMLVGTQLPGVSSAYLDERVVGLGAGDLVLAALVRAPLGTALFEEVAFRGVLLAMLTRRFGLGWGVLGSCAAFGAWHVVPALGISAGNAAIDSALGGHALWAAAAGVVAAGCVGGFLCLLRIRYDHLVVPLAVHATSNSLAYVLAWLMLR